MTLEAAMCVVTLFTLIDTNLIDESHALIIRVGY